MREISARCHHVLTIAWCGCLALLVVTHRVEGQTDPLLLISLDGCRHDYLERAQTPTLDRLRGSGLHAAGLQPPFPAKTFPSHYTLVTGLHPAHHGVVDNVIYDPENDATFALYDREELHRSRWWRGEPIWVTVQRAGMKAAPFHWPGSEAEIAGLRPTYWEPYDHHMPHRKKIRKVLSFLDMPPENRPHFITLYFPDIDTAGHRHGPDGAEVVRALEQIDHSLGHLVDGLVSRDLLSRIHILIVSDHGMTSVDSDRTILLDDHIDLSDLSFVRTGVVGGLRAPESRLETLYKTLENAHPRLRVFYREETPEALHYRSNSLIPPLVLLPQLGWQVLSRRSHERRDWTRSKGAHGYDGLNPDMHGIFIATGPRIPDPRSLPVVRAVDVYNLMCELLDVSPASNDGGSFLVDAIAVN